MPASVTTNTDLSGKHYAFFGGTSGISQAAAIALAKQHANLAVIGRSISAGEETVKILQQAGATSAIFIAGDLSTIVGAKNVAVKVQQWSSSLDGIVHSAMTAFNSKITTSEGLEFAYALQYQARVTIDSILLDNLDASGDGRVIHISGAVPSFITPDLDDLQWEKNSYGFWKAILGTHVLTFMFIQEAAKRWTDKRVSIAAVCVGSTKTKAMADPNMPFLMRLFGKFGTTADVSAKNAVAYLTAATIPAEERFGILWDPKKFAISQPQFAEDRCEKLWGYTSRIASKNQVQLPYM